jgi:hypothetical protein
MSVWRCAHGRRGCFGLASACLHGINAQLLTSGIADRDGRKHFTHEPEHNTRARECQGRTVRLARAIAYACRPFTSRPKLGFVFDCVRGITIPGYFISVRSALHPRKDARIVPVTIRGTILLEVECLHFFGYLVLPSHRHHRHHRHHRRLQVLRHLQISVAQQTAPKADTSQEMNIGCLCQLSCGSGTAACSQDKIKTGQHREAAAPTESLQGPRLLHYGGRYAYLAPVRLPAMRVSHSHMQLLQEGAACC